MAAIRFAYPTHRQEERSERAEEIKGYGNDSRRLVALSDQEPWIWVFKRPFCHVALLDSPLPGG